mmetsp:Transcript_18274/g.39340  ORF Transcript_18274/g.39340 Transcript_18274/m.39340 type:complete len:302 (+) Transcript_18274:259-1164(+)|eukprot:CAMPEP_0202897384 /NCGR_PEP_ID=MMETSP1392-20130828/6155_1 /ASSEMBLY_ACC=CAM_ASM_000868 /TAXON_ID=225041 /ORGANISM="Chlamydomonas chlamydogama, Strain SAG 11-48b" /LENGTH=301 /DNA_ID=CAMNT_0049583001 /DNA_START=244 /DNA_END=1149 /DNA_ORIENTATION=+
MGDSIAKAEELRRQAEKKLKSFGFFGNKYEDAADLLEKAANNFKLAKCWDDAVDCYIKLADCQIKLDSKHEAATAYVEGAKCGVKSKKSNPTELLKRAVALYTDMGRLNMAARQLRELAELTEKSAEGKGECLVFYEQAADLFDTEDSTSEATKCKLKIAEISAELGSYPKSVELFEGAARRAVENNLLKFSARGYLLNAGICYMCYCSPDDLEIKIEKYKDLDLQLSGSRECMLLEQLWESMRDTDVEKFATALADFDRVIRLDPWKTKILLVVKDRIQNMELGVGTAAGGGAEEDDDLQ